MPQLTESPRPVPSPTSLVVKNGSKMRARVASSMPAPVSRTSIAIHGRAAGRAADVRRRHLLDDARRDRRPSPPAGVAWIALTTRFVSTCVS